MALSRYNQQQNSGLREPEELEGVLIKLIKSHTHNETDKAALFRIDNDMAEFWLPLSEISIMPTTEDHIKMVKMPLWLAQAKKISRYAE